MVVCPPQPQTTQEGQEGAESDNGEQFLLEDGDDQAGPGAREQPRAANPEKDLQRKIETAAKEQEYHHN